MIAAVHAWWSFLWLAAIFNILAWSLSAALLKQRGHRYSSSEHRIRRLSLWLSAGYVIGCAFRSFFPRIDLERICLVDSWLSAMVVGRSVATVAELCFIAQCALLLHEAGRQLDSRFAIVVSLLLVPIITVAEGASWYAILSTNYMGDFIENSLWTLAATLLLVSCMFFWSRSGRLHRFLAAMLLFTSGYIFFMLSVDLPMYWSRWNAELVAGTKYLPLLQGLIEASQLCIVSFDWHIWREEIPWMTLYFTIAVWVSIFLPHAPIWQDDTLPDQMPSPPARADEETSRVITVHPEGLSADPRRAAQD